MKRVNVKSQIVLIVSHTMPEDGKPDARALKELREGAIDYIRKNLNAKTLKHSPPVGIAGNSPKGAPHGEETKGREERQGEGLQGQASEAKGNADAGAVDRGQGTRSGTGDVAPPSAESQH